MRRRPAANQLIRDGVSMIAPVFVDMAKLIGPASALARETDHSVYDCIYVTLARQRDLALVTLDQKFVAAFAGTDAGGAFRHCGAGVLPPRNSVAAEPAVTARRRLASIASPLSLAARNAATK